MDEFEESQHGHARQRPTLADVAGAVGVSPKTVSRVVNGSKHISEATRVRVQAAINALGYVPNPAAQSLKRRSNVRVAVLSSIPNSSYVIELLEGALDEAARHNVQLLFRRERGMVDPMKAARTLISMGADGFLLTPPFSTLGALVEMLTSEQMQIVLLGDRYSHSNVTAVGMDDEAAAFEMTNHLIGLGHRNIGFIAGDEHHTATHYRRNGYRRALAAQGIAHRPEWEAGGDFNYQAGFDAAQQILRQEELPTAIFSSNDDMAAGAIAAANAHGIRVPDELSVCGFDDSLIATAVKPELTTIRQPIRGIAAEAMKLLIRRIEHEGDIGDLPRQILLPYELIRRCSDGPPAKASPRRRDAA
jgi:LacI family transcriptional regulator